MYSIGDTIFRSNILGVGISAINMEMALEQIRDWIGRGAQTYVCVTGVHGIMESWRDERLRRIHNNAGMVTPDGMPLVWLNRLRGFEYVKRVYGPDFLLAVCERSLQTGWSHYFYGGGVGVAEKLSVQLIKHFPGLKVAGTEAPPFRPLTHEEDQAMIMQINAAKADILWVGLGTPKQEYWMSEHLGKVDAPVMIGVGAAFDFLAGIKKQAPRWMQSNGLEWLYRLTSEPRRLWRRYLINNPLFLLLVFLQLLGIKRYTID